MLLNKWRERVSIYPAHSSSLYKRMILQVSQQVNLCHWFHLTSYSAETQFMASCFHRACFVKNKIKKKPNDAWLMMISLFWALRTPVSLFLTPHPLPQREPIISRSLTKFKNIIILLPTFLCSLIFRGNSKISLWYHEADVSSNLGAVTLATVPPLSSFYKDAFRGRKKNEARRLPALHSPLCSDKTPSYAVIPWEVQFLSKACFQFQKPHLRFAYEL